MSRKLLLTAFAVSGFTALVYEVVWARPLQLIFGSTIYAVSTILTTFFIGFALGSFLFRNVADNVKNPLKLFGLIQLGIGLYGLIILWLFKLLPGIYIPIASIPGIQFIQFALLFTIIIVPATLFGATWPIMNKAYIREERIGKDVGRLYAWNSFGSFLGPLAAGFLLIPLLGIMATSILVAALNLAVGAIILLVYGGKNGA
jgi:spermidine synthase